jgi:acetyltransferase-like isoleucine patch superfamily enzyme
MIAKFFKYSLKDKFFILIHMFYVLKTQLIYGSRFKSIGAWSSFSKKLYMTHRVISLGKGVTIGPHARIEGVYRWNENTYSPHIIIEDDVSIQQRCHITAASELIIGKGSMLSFDVMLTDVDHEYSSIGIPIGKQDLAINKTRIGERCFIGAGAKIMAGTLLGEQCVVGANTVVRGKFPAFCVIAGTPARILKRYDEKSESWKRTDKIGRFL